MVSLHSTSVYTAAVFNTTKFFKSTVSNSKWKMCMENLYKPCISFHYDFCKGMKAICYSINEAAVVKRTRTNLDLGGTDYMSTLILGLWKKNFWFTSAKRQNLVWDFHQLLSFVTDF